MFKILSKEQYEALDVREQVKYEIELEAHKKSEQEKSVKEAVAKELESLKEDNAKNLATLKEEQEKAVKDIQEKAKADLETLEAKLKTFNLSTDRNERVKTMSDYIMAKLSTEEGENLLKAFAKGSKGAFNTEIEGIEKATMLKPTGNGGYVSPEMAGIYGEGHDFIHARTVMRVLPTASDVVKFLQITPDPAKVIGKTGEAQTKNELDYISTVKKVDVIKLTGLLDIADEMLEDVVGFRAFISAELPLAYLEAEDQYVFNDPVDGIFTLAEQWVPNGTVTETSNAWDKIVSAATQIRLNKRYPTAVFLSPVGYQELLINKDLEEAYSYPIVLDGNGTLRVAGMAVYSSNILENDEFLVGDFASGAALWQKKAMTVAYSEEHKDNFAKNIVTIRIEGRLAVTVYKTDAFVKGTFTVAPTT